MQTDIQLQPLSVPVSKLELDTWCLAPDWKDELSEHLRSLLLAKRSEALARQHIGLFAAWYEEAFDRPFEPGAITNFALMEYRRYSLNEKKVMARTWNSRWWALNILCKWGGCQSAMEGVEQKQVAGRSEAHRHLTNAEYNRLHETIERAVISALTDFQYRDAVRDRLAVILMNDGGLRVDEVCQADKADIRISERKICVLVRHGKGDKERKTYVDIRFKKAFTDWLDLRADDIPALFDGESADGRVATRTFHRLMTDLRPVTNIPDLVCHSLRFTYAKRLEKSLIGKGWGRSEIVRLIADRLGHRSTDTTELYLHSSEDEFSDEGEE